MSGSMQQAVFVREVGKPLEIETRKIPIPPAGHVLIRVLAVQCGIFDPSNRQISTTS